MKLRLVFQSRFAALIRVEAITLYPFIFFRRRREEVEEWVIRHEYEHVKQQREDGPMFFVRYLWAYYANLIRMKDKAQAYRAIAYEVSAYEAQTIALTDSDRIDLHLEKGDIA